MKAAESSQRQLVVGFGVLAPLVVSTTRLAVLAMGASQDHARHRRAVPAHGLLLSACVQALSQTVIAGTCITQALLSKPDAPCMRTHIDTARHPQTQTIGEQRKELAKLIGHVRFLTDSVNVVASQCDPKLNLLPRAYDDASSSQEAFAGVIRAVDQFHLNVERLSLADEPGRAALSMPVLAEQSAQTARDIRTLALGASRQPDPSATDRDLSHTMHDIVEQLHRMARLIGELTAVPSEALVSPWQHTHAH